MPPKRKAASVATADPASNDGCGYLGVALGVAAGVGLLSLALSNTETDRVHLSGTRSKESLPSLSEADFTEADSAVSGASIESVKTKLDGVIGLAGVKKHVLSLVAQLQVVEMKKARGIPCGKMNATMHMVFSGNPGTGKTTIARLVAELLQSLGYLKRGHLVETDRAGLVGRYQGQTAIKTTEVVESAMGGVLFVDEAYALVQDSQDSFGKEALNTLIKLVEDKRDELVVVLAGYPAEMEELMAHNPGVQSRFPTVILFEDYNVAELMQIATGFLGERHLTMTPEATASLEAKLAAMVNAPNVQNGNGRAVRNMIEQAIRAQSSRLMNDPRLIKDRLINDQATLPSEELSKLSAEDFVPEPLVAPPSLPQRTIYRKISDARTILILLLATALFPAAVLVWSK